MTPPYLPILLICLVSIALVVVGLGRRRHLQRSHRVALVAFGLLGCAWVGWVIYQMPILGNLTLAEVAGPYRHTNRGVVDRLELGKDCSFSRTLSRTGVVLVRQTGRWGPVLAESWEVCAMREGDCLRQVHFVSFDPRCGDELSRLDRGPDMTAIRPFCNSADWKPSEFAFILSTGGRPAIAADDYLWVRE